MPPSVRVRVKRGKFMGWEHMRAGGKKGGREGGRDEGGGHEEQDQATFFHLFLLVSAAPKISASVVPLNPVSFTAVSRSRR